MYTRKNDDGTVGVTFQTTKGEVDVTMSRAQALALGALLVSDSASGILYAIEDAQIGRTLKPLLRVTQKGLRNTAEIADLHSRAKQALEQGHTGAALDLLDRPWRLGLEMTQAQAQENQDLETRARLSDSARASY
jgi:hypothetical protein